MEAGKINNEIETLKNKIINLENIKKELSERKTDTNKNFEILSKAINDRKKKVEANSHGETWIVENFCERTMIDPIVAKFIDKDMIDPLEAIYNILFIMNNKINELEHKINLNKD